MIVTKGRFRNRGEGDRCHTESMAQRSSSKWDGLACQLSPEVIDVLFPHAVEGPERQGRTWDTLDRKALGVLTTASVSIGLTVFAIAGSAPVGTLVFFSLTLAS